MGNTYDEQADDAGRPVMTRWSTARHVLGWSAVALMLFLVAVLTVLLAGMLSVVSVWLTAVVPAVVLLLLVLLAVYVRSA